MVYTSSERHDPVGARHALAQARYQWHNYGILITLNWLLFFCLASIR
jgi:hypothetical protein